MVQAAFGPVEEQDRETLVSLIIMGGCLTRQSPMTDNGLASGAAEIVSKKKMITQKMMDKMLVVEFSND